MTKSRKPTADRETLQAKIERHDFLLAELCRLTDAALPEGERAVSRHAALMRRCDKLSREFRAIAAIPEVNAAILKREQAERAA